jgi:pimeloyl-ACP methyl ester carboxylesterase
MDTAIAIDAIDEAKPWMVMVHGMSQDHRIFSEQVAVFRDTHRILLVDLPGHGLSAFVDGPFGHVEFARHVAAAMVEHHVSHATYWGTHTGATVGLLLAATRPELIATLVLEGPLIPGANPPIVTHLISHARARLAQDGLPAALEDWWSNSCWFDHMRAHPAKCRADAHRAIVMDFGGAPWRDNSTPAQVLNIEAKLHAISQPTLIYNGEADHPDFHRAAKHIASLIEGAQKIRIADAGGFPAWEHSDDVNHEVANFLGVQH